MKAALFLALLALATAHNSVKEVTDPDEEVLLAVEQFVDGIDKFALAVEQPKNVVSLAKVIGPEWTSLYKSATDAGKHLQALTHKIQVS